MNDSLLSHIAGNFISQYENVANSCIAYLLNRYPEARQALANTLDVTEVPIRYVTEEATDNGRPDVVGKNAAGEIAVILEGKFWASLTNNQPQNYLRLLEATSGHLLFLAPIRRQNSLRLEIDTRLSDAPENSKIRCHVESWANFLDAVENENSQTPESQLSSDLKQIRSLCERMDVEGMPPLTESDLDPMHGRIAFQLSDLINDCYHRLRDWSATDFRGLRVTSSQDSYYFYFRAHGYGCTLKFSNKLWFTTDAHTPFWLSVGDSDFGRHEPALNAIANWKPKAFYDTDGVDGLALFVRAGMDRDAAVESLVDQIKSAINFLASLLPAES